MQRVKIPPFTDDELRKLRARGDSVDMILARADIRHMDLARVRTILATETKGLS